MGKALGGVSGPCGETVEAAALVEDTGRKVDIQLGSDVKVCGGVLDDGVIHPAAPENGCIVYC